MDTAVGCSFALKYLSLCLTLVGTMFSTGTQRKYWTFHEESELEQLREEVNHQYVSKNGGGDMEADVSHYCSVRHTLRHWVTLSFRNTKVLHQTLNPTAELWCKTLSRIMFAVKPRF